MPTSITTLLTVLAVTVSAVEDSMLYGALPFLLAFLNEGARIWATSGSADETEI